MHRACAGICVTPDRVSASAPRERKNFSFRRPLLYWTARETNKSFDAARIRRASIAAQRSLFRNSIVNYFARVIIAILPAISRYPRETATLHRKYEGNQGFFHKYTQYAIWLSSKLIKDFAHNGHGYRFARITSLAFSPDNFDSTRNYCHYLHTDALWSRKLERDATQLIIALAAPCLRPIDRRALLIGNRDSPTLSLSVTRLTPMIHLHDE